MSTSKSARSSHEEALSLVRRVSATRSAWLYARHSSQLRWRAYKRCWAELRGSVLLLHVVGEQSARANPEVLAKRTAPENIILIQLKDTRLRSDPKKSRLKIKRMNDATLEIKLKDGVDTKKWHTALVRAATQRSVGLADFEIISQVGKGASGRVYLVRDRHTGEQLALKVIEKVAVYENNDALRHALDERLVLEMATDHPFVLNLRYAFQTSRRLYLVTEYCVGGDLFDYLRKRGKPFRENQGRRIAAEILLALEHIHSLGVVYRDLKLENVLLDLDGHIRIADFGLSKLLGTPSKSKRPGGFDGGRNQAPSSYNGRVHSNLGAGPSFQQPPNVRVPSAPVGHDFDDDDDLGGPQRQAPRTMSHPGNTASLTRTFCGTREYVAPEMLSGNEYGQSVDLWAYGILLYEILCGRTPFYSKNRDEVYEKIENAPLRFPRHLSPEVTSLIQGLLDRNPNTRLGLGATGITAIKRHVWFSSVSWEATLCMEPHPDAIVVEQSQMAHTPSFGSNVTGGPGGSGYDNLSGPKMTNADTLLDDDMSDGATGDRRPDVFAMFVSTKKKASNIAGYSYRAPAPYIPRPGAQ
jgi:serine/threonine protein kinase